MNAVIYASKGGNTKKLADAAAAAIGVKAAAAEGTAIAKGTDILFIGASLYAGGIDGKLKKFLSAMKPGSAKKIVVFGSAASDKSAQPIVRDLVRNSDIPVDERFFQCRGQFLLSFKGRPDANDLKGVADFAKSFIQNQ